VLPRWVLYSLYFKNSCRNVYSSNRRSFEAQQGGCGYEAETVGFGAFGSPVLTGWAEIKDSHQRWHPRSPLDEERYWPVSAFALLLWRPLFSIVPFSIRSFLLQFTSNRLFRPSCCFLLASSVNVASYPFQQSPWS
jgi:hypothetical protein